MSIASEISRLQTAKADLKIAIEGKGVTVPSSTKLDGYADLVDSIETGGGGGTMYTYICLGGMMDSLSTSEASHLEGVQMWWPLAQEWGYVNDMPDPASQFYYRFTGGYLDNSNNHTIHGMCVGDENDTKIFDFHG